MYQAKLECCPESLTSVLMAIMMYFFPPILNDFVLVSEQDKLLFSNQYPCF